jgi:molybdopterin converting factor small subunit
VAAVTVSLPRLLADLVGGDRRVSVDADDVAGALAAVCARHPQLRVHVFDGAGDVRPHVTCLVDGIVVRETLDRPLADDDEVVVLQAVSGGCA